MKRLFALFLSASAPALGIAAADDSWFRDAAISPNGEQVLFNAFGDIWLVPAAGGRATALTVDDAWEGHAIWSRDGQKIAFASDRFGDLDIFVMNTDGSALERLTFHDSDDMPSDFSPDGARVLFSSARGDDADASYFPTGALPELYEVKVTGGAPTRLSSVPAMQARWSPDGRMIAYREEKAYESELRQRDTSSFARDIWVLDVASGKHRRLTDNPGGDHAPVWKPDGSALYVLSEVDGARFGVHELSLEDGTLTRLTDHGNKPARGLSISDDGRLATSVHGVLYTVEPGADPVKIEVELPAMPLRNTPEPLAVGGNVSDFAISPDGKEIAFVARGEIFVTATDFSATTQVTDTPEQERSVAFTADGRGLVYAAERGGSWAIFRTTLDDEAEARFSAATAFTEQELYRARGSDAFQPVVSPDGASIAFVEGRDAIRVMDADGSGARTVFAADLNYSYSDGDLSFTWSPDSAWLTASFAPRGYVFYTDIGVARADGSGAPVDISLNGYTDFSPFWHGSGDVIYWYTDRFGERTHGSWGGEGDIVAGFLNQDAWDRFNLTEHEQALLAEAEEKNKEEADEDEEDLGDVVQASFDKVLTRFGLKEAADESLAIDFDNVRHRTVRLTRHSSDLADARLAPDLSALYYLSAFEGGYDLWKQDLEKGDTVKLASLGAQSVRMELLPEDGGLLLLADGALSKIGFDGSREPVEVDGEMRVLADAERAYMFEHVWRQVADKFYDPAFHGLDWNQIRTDYEGKVAGVSNNRDFATLISEMLGELNASHTGMYYRTGDPSRDDRTAALGVIFDTSARGGLVVGEVLRGGPLDRDGLDVRAGDRIVAINGRRIEGDANPYAALNRKAGDRLRLTLAGQGTRGERDITVRTFSRGAENELLYQRWIERRRAIVDERSDGRIGYVHIRSMDDGGFREVFADLFGQNFDKEAVVIDTRFNGGGWLHDDLVTLFSGERYFDMRPRGRRVRGAPEERWAKPSIVVMNEGNYSNAHMFPYAYKLLGIGKLVGMPVPGTATAVWWEPQMTGDVYFGIPQLPVLDQEGNPLENQTLQPDILVDNPPEAALAGEDRPLEAAVDDLLTELGKN